MEHLKTEFRMSGSGDPWGECMAWLFAICDVLHFHCDCAEPAEWLFRPSPFGPFNETYEYEIATGCTKEELLAFGHLLTRYARILRHQGKNY